LEGVNGDEVRPLLWPASGTVREETPGWNLMVPESILHLRISRLEVIFELNPADGVLGEGGWGRAGRGGNKR